MMYSQYCRIENKAGGVFAPPRRMLKAFRTILSKQGKSHECRAYRHALITEMFELQSGSQAGLFRHKHSTL